MAVRRPIVFIGGRLVELPASDVLPSGVYLASSTAPADPEATPFWFDLDTGAFLVWVDDGVTAAWIEVGSSGGGGGGGAGFYVGLTAPDPAEYPLWFDLTNGAFLVWVDDGTSAQWIEPGAAPLPTGGTALQALIKQSGSDFDADWGGIGPSMAQETHAATQKNTPVDSDEFAISDSADSWAIKKLTWAYLKTTLGSVFVGKTGAQVMVGDLTIPSLNGGQFAGHRNTIINGDWSQNVRALTSVGDDAYFLDRWYILTETGNVTIGQLTDAESGAPFGVRLTQPDASPKRLGFAQIIESKNIRQYASRAMHLAARLRLSTGANIRYAVIEHTGTVDVVTSDVVNNWASATFTPSNFFIAGVNIIRTGSITPGAATWGEVSDWDVLGASVKNVIVFIWTESQVAQSVTLDCSRIQYEPGTVATPHEWRHNEQQLTIRYARRNLSSFGWSVSSTQVQAYTAFETRMRTAPAISVVNGTLGLLQPGVIIKDITGIDAGTSAVDVGGGILVLTGTSLTNQVPFVVYEDRVLFSSEL